jgi:hypothetical protein
MPEKRIHRLSREELHKAVWSEAMRVWRLALAFRTSRSRKRVGARPFPFQNGATGRNSERRKGFSLDKGGLQFLLWVRALALNHNVNIYALAHQLAVGLTQPTNAEDR